MTCTDTHLTCHAPPQASGLTYLTHYLGVWRSRRALAKLDARLLADVGLSAEQVQRETQRKVWDVPSHWVKN